MATSTFHLQGETRLVEMITSGHVNDMTIQEIQSMLKLYQSCLADAQKIILFSRNKLRPYQNRCLEIQSFLDRGQGTKAQRKQWQNMLLSDQERVASSSLFIARYEGELVEIQQRLQLLEATLAAKQRDLAPQPVVVPAVPDVAPAVPDAVDAVIPEPVAPSNCLMM